MCSSAPSLPGGLCAPPASRSPPSAGTSHSRPAWHCPAGGAGYPDLEDARVMVEEGVSEDRGRGRGGSGDTTGVVNWRV